MILSELQPQSEMHHDRADLAEAVDDVQALGHRTGRAAGRLCTVAIISSFAKSLSHFRGPLIKALAGAGLRVYALAPDYDDQTREAVRILGAEPIDITLNRTGTHPLRDVRDLVRLIRTLRKLSPDAVLSYFIKPVIYGSIAATLARVPRRFVLIAGLGYVYTPDGTADPLYRRALRVLVSRLYGVALGRCEKVFFYNEDDRREFLDRGLLESARTHMLTGTGVDLDQLPLAPPIESPPTFLLMARLLREKGVVEYAEAARMVRRSHPQARFLLLGSLDSNPGGLSKEEVSLWAEQGIEWHGHVDDVRPWIAKSSVYVLPSYREGKPRSTQEAMAMGRPVITTDAPGCRDTVEEGLNGYLVPVRDPDALAAAMLRFIENPELIAKMGLESRRLAEARFDVHRINSRILETIGIRPSASL